MPLLAGAANVAFVIAVTVSVPSVAVATLESVITVDEVILIHPKAMLVFQERASKELVRMRRTSGLATFFGLKHWVMLLVTGLVIAGAVTAGYLRSLEGSGNIEHGRAMALATFTLASAAVTAGLSRLRTLAAWRMCLGTFLTSFLLIQTPRLDTLLHLSPLHWDDWLLAMLASNCAAFMPLGFEAWNGQPR